MPDLILLYVHWAGLARYAPTAPRRLLEEPHGLVLDTGSSKFLVKQCKCEVCARDPDLVDAATVPLGELADWLANAPEEQKANVELLVVISEEMASPMPSGEPTAAADYAVALSRAMSERGVASKVVVERATEAYPEGTWLRATAEAADSMEHVLLPGMIGRAVVTDFSYVICTPGISQMTLVEGRREPYGHRWEALEPMDRLPTPEEIELSRKLCEHAVEEFQRHHGWQGYVMFGGHAQHEHGLRRELEKLVRERDQKGCAGSIRRLAKLLRALASHPNGADLATVAAELTARSRSKPDVALLARVTAWMATNPAVPDADRARRDAQLRRVGVESEHAICDVCHQAPAEQVHASGFGAFSFSDCLTCREKGAEPYEDVVSNVAIVWRGYDHLDEVQRRMVAASCAVAGKSLATFLADVAAAQKRALPDDWKEPRVVIGANVFAFDIAVVPIATGGRPAGKIAEQAVSRGFVLPDLQLGQARYRKIGPHRHIYVAGPDEWTPAQVFECTSACLGAGSPSARAEYGDEERDLEIAFPIFGSAEQRSAHMAIMRDVVAQVAEDGVATGFMWCPKVVFVGE